jgi:hypothetical protein
MNQESTFWISPEGELFRVREGCHEEWAAENICPEKLGEFCTSYPFWEEEDSADSQDYRGAVFQAAWEAGWTDANFDPTERILYLRNPNAATLPSRPRFDELAVQNGWALATDWWKLDSLPFFDARPPEYKGNHQMKIPLYWSTSETPLN